MCYLQARNDLIRAGDGNLGERGHDGDFQKVTPTFATTVANTTSPKKSLTICLTAQNPRLKMALKLKFCDSPRNRVQLAINEKKVNRELC